jgi:hypothetical protein
MPDSEVAKVLSLFFGNRMVTQTTRRIEERQLFTPTEIEFDSFFIHSTTTTTKKVLESVPRKNTQSSSSRERLCALLSCVCKRITPCASSDLIAKERGILTTTTTFS